MLTLDHIEIQQGDFRLTASLSIAAGLTAIIGPSGGGKSTLLSAIAGFLEPASGRVRWGDADITDVPAGQRPASMLFQDNNLFPHLTVHQNVALAIKPNLKLSQSQAADVDAVLTKVGLSGFGTRKPSALSGGQQGRAALARALVADRPIVLLDEPFSALGPALRQEMLALVQTHLVEGGKTVIMVTHDPNDAKVVADAVILIDEGRANPPVSTGQIFNDPPKALRDYLGQS